MGVTLNYGGIGLLDPTQDADLWARLNQYVDWGDFPELVAPDFTGTDDWRVVQFTGDYKVKLGRLYYPRSASSFAYAHFVIDEVTLNYIRKQAYTSSGLIPLPLEIGDQIGGPNGEGSAVSINMYMIPPRPLFQYDTPDGTGANLYLLTLVDERFWWWRKSTATGAASTWSSITSSLASALGITLTVGSIPAEYLTPPNDLLATKEYYLPPLLDAVAYSIGMRIVRNLDGTYLCQAPGDAFTTNATLLAAYGYLTTFGGAFCFAGNQPGSSSYFQDPPTNDLPAQVPDTFRMVVDEMDSRLLVGSFDPSSFCNKSYRCGADRLTYDVTLGEIEEQADFSGYEGIVAKPGFKIVHSTAAAWTNDGGSTNFSDTELTNLAFQMASDWYNWQLADQSRVLAGIVPWQGDGSVDVVEWEAYPVPRTYLFREPMNDLTNVVYHKTTAPTAPCIVINCGLDSSSSYYGSCCPSNFTVVDPSTWPGWDKTKIQVPAHDCNGCYFWITVGEC